MIALDTPLLQDLLEARPRAKRWVDSLEGAGEVCTTELNLFELGEIAQRAGPKGRGRRLQALENVRRQISVLPVLPEASRWALEARARGSARGGGAARTGGSEAVGGLGLLILGVVATHGGREVWTNRPRFFPKTSGEPRVVPC